MNIPVVASVKRWTALAFLPIVERMDVATPRQRQVVAIAISLALHVCLVLSLLPSTTSLSASVGAVTGLGNVNGIGTAVTLVDVSELAPPKVSQPEAPEISAEDLQAKEASDTTEAASDSAAPEEAKPSMPDNQKETAASTAQAVTDAPSDGKRSATAGAFGHNGQTNIDLWNAIAPCWNRITDKDTLSATLTISFADDGGLSEPPVIERDPNAPITDQSLKSEALALQALAECGAYPMARGQRGITVQFPRSDELPVQPTGSQGSIASVQR